MRVDDNSSFSNEVAEVVVHIGIGSYEFDDAYECFEEIFVSALVEGVNVLFDVG